MKRKLLTAVLFVALIFAAVGCGRGTVKRTVGTLSVNVYAAGYGTGWIEEAVRVFKEENPGVKVDLEASPLAFGAVQTALENGNCKDDVILVGAASYKPFISKGYLEDLTDLYATKLTDSDKTVGDVVESNIKEKYRTQDNKFYGIPWQENYPSGLVYNKKMFAKYGWDQDLPETMDEFWELCERIVTDTQKAVTPLTFGGADGNGYLYTNFPQWLMEYYGYEGYNKFLDLESPKAYEDQAEGRAKIYETIAKFTKGATKSGMNIALAGSEGATAITAQTNFVNGQTAMIVHGQYFMNEMAEYMELKNFEVGYLPMPHINDDKKSGDDSIDTSDVRYSSDNGVMAIPATSVNKELAKKFLASMLTAKSYATFIQSTHGLLRPLRGIAVDTSGFDDFTRAAYEYFNADGHAKTTYKYSRNNLIENNELGVFFAYQGGFFGRITEQATYEEALKVAKGCVANELSYVYEKWDAGKNEWK